MANKTIGQLPAAAALTGTELVPIEQGAGPAVRTTTQAIANLSAGGVDYVIARALVFGDGSLSDDHPGIASVIYDEIGNPGAYTIVFEEGYFDPAYDLPTVQATPHWFSIRLVGVTGGDSTQVYIQGRETNEVAASAAFHITVIGRPGPGPA